MSDTSKVHGPYYLEYKTWDGRYRPVKDAKTSGYATEYRTITEARKKAVSFMRKNSCQLVGIQGGIGRSYKGRDGRPVRIGGTAGIVEKEDWGSSYIYHDYNTGKHYRIGKDGSVKQRK